MRRRADEPFLVPDPSPGFEKTRPLRPPERLIRPVRPLDQAARERVVEHEPLSWQLAWLFRRKHARDVPIEELVSEAMYGLTYAASLYDTTRRVPFGAYAALVIRHRLIHGARLWRRSRRLVPFPDSLPNEGPWEIADPLAREPGSDRTLEEMCDRVRRILPPRWYAVLRMHHAEGRTFEEIGACLGLTRQRVKQLATRAGERARRHFPDWTRF